MHCPAHQFAPGRWTLNTRCPHYDCIAYWPQWLLIVLYCAFYWVLRKIKEDTARVVIVVPVWRNQPFWPMLMKLLTAKPVLLSGPVVSAKPFKDETFSEEKTNATNKVICTVSRNGSDNEVFLERQPTCSCCHGGNQQKQCMICTYQDGADMQIKNKWIQFCHL